MNIAILGDPVPFGFARDDGSQHLGQTGTIGWPQPGDQVGLFIAEQAALGLTGGGDPDAIAFAAEMAGYGGDDTDAAPGAGDAEIPRRTGKRPLVDRLQGVVCGDALPDFVSGNAVALPVVFLDGRHILDETDRIAPGAG